MTRIMNVAVSAIYIKRRKRSAPNLGLKYRKTAKNSKLILTMRLNCLTWARLHRHVTS